MEPSWKTTAVPHKKSLAILQGLAVSFPDMHPRELKTQVIEAFVDYWYL